MKKGIVYIVQNPAFPHLFKIGYTEQNTIEDRGLNASNVPEDFEILFGYECHNPKEIEDHLQKTFKNFRHFTRKGRRTEFFYIGCLLEAKETLRLLNGAKEVSGEIVLEKNNKTEYDERKNIEKVIKKPFNFGMVNIKSGTTLVFTKNENEYCVVKDNKMVLYNNKEYSLSDLAVKLMKKEGFAGEAYQGPAYFKVKGRKETLKEMRDGMENGANNKIEYDEIKSIEEKTKKQKSFTFDMVNIKPGTTLVFTENEKKECIVKDKNKVLYNNKPYFLSALTRELMKERGSTINSYRGTLFFKVKGKKDTLNEMREKMENA